MKVHFKSFLLIAGFVLTLTRPLAATDGYFQTGYGVIQQGQGGAGVALPADSLAAATNPAGMVFVGTRFDFGVTYFRPIRFGTITGNTLPPGYPNVNGRYDPNGRTNFFLPELGYNRLIRPKLSFGVALFGNGGLNTTYRTPIPLLGSTKAGVDLEQLFISPTVAYKFTPHNSVGVSLNIAYQLFRAEGLQNFATPNSSSAPADVTDHGYHYSAGAGVRVGWLGEINKYVSLGATYQSETFVSKFDKYRGLFAEQGGFNIPANFAGGVALKPTTKLTVFLDVERIQYGQIKSIANSGSNQALLGSNNGPGFGWNDITAIKTGVAYKVSPKLTVRGGYNHSGQPIPNTETFFNLLAPGVVQNHVTAGATWKLSGSKELNFAYLHAFEGTVNGSSSIPPNAGGGNANLTMHQDSIGVSYGWNGK